MLRHRRVWPRISAPHFRTQGEQAINARVKVTVWQTLFRSPSAPSPPSAPPPNVGYGAFRVLGPDLVGRLLVVMAYIALIYKPLKTISNTIGSLQEVFIALHGRSTCSIPIPKSGRRGHTSPAPPGSLMKTSFPLSNPRRYFDRISFAAGRRWSPSSGPPARAKRLSSAFCRAALRPPKAASCSMATYLQAHRRIAAPRSASSQSPLVSARSPTTSTTAGSTPPWTRSWTPARNAGTSLNYPSNITPNSA